MRNDFPWKYFQFKGYLDQGEEFPNYFVSNSYHKSISTHELQVKFRASLEILICIYKQLTKTLPMKLLYYAVASALAMTTINARFLQDIPEANQDAVVGFAPQLDQHIQDCLFICLNRGRVSCKVRSTQLSPEYIESCRLQLQYLQNLFTKNVSKRISSYILEKYMSYGCRSPHQILVPLKESKKQGLRRTFPIETRVLSYNLGFLCGIPPSYYLSLCFSGGNQLFCTHVDDVEDGICCQTADTCFISDGSQDAAEWLCQGPAGSMNDKYDQEQDDNEEEQPSQ